MASEYYTFEINMVRVDARKAITEITKQFGFVSNDTRNVAVARAINHTIAKSKTQLTREIRRIYDIPLKYINEQITVKKADRLTLTGVIRAKGRPLPLIAFRARQTKGGVSVITPKGRKIIPGVFIQNMPTGRAGIFVRGRYQAGNILRRKHRVKPTGNDLPIMELKGVSIPKTLQNKKISETLAKSIEEMFPQRLAHELTYATTFR
jgi:hypothetical protein